MKKWHHESRGDTPNWILRNMLINMSTISVKEDRVRVVPTEPRYPDRAPWEFALHASFGHTPAGDYVGELNGVLSAQLPFSSVNRNHPLTGVAIEAQMLEDSEEFQQFSISAAYCLSNQHTFEALSKPNQTSTYQMRRVGQKCLDIDWTRVSDGLKPPYTIWLKGKGKVQIDYEDFERWATDDSKIVE